MTFTRYAIFPVVLVTLSACETEKERQADAAEDRIEQIADQSAAAAGNVEAALGMTERQLLDADLVAEDGSELGDIEQIRRDSSGIVTGLLVEVEDSNPDRYVIVPLDGLSVRASAIGDSDVQTSMTAQDLAAMPDVSLVAP